jgi:hypothetical protein
MGYIDHAIHSGLLLQAVGLCLHNAHPTKCTSLTIMNSLHAALNNTPGPVYFHGYSSGLYVR